MLGSKCGSMLGLSDGVSMRFDGCKADGRDVVWGPVLGLVEGGSDDGIDGRIDVRIADGIDDGFADGLEDERWIGSELGFESGPVEGWDKH